MDDWTKNEVLRALERIERGLRRMEYGQGCNDRDIDELLGEVESIARRIRYIQPSRCKMFSGMPCPYMR